MADSPPDTERMLFLRREAEKIVRELFGAGGAPSSPRPGDTAAAPVRLLADLRSEGDRYVWEVEVPGVRVADLKVTVFGDSVVVEGRKELRAHGPGRPVYERAERAYGSFRRVFDWPGPADASQTAATLKRGVLRISVRRIADRRARRPRAIRVQPERDHD
jgi:HSP20 family protein